MDTSLQTDIDIDPIPVGLAYSSNLTDDFEINHLARIERDLTKAEPANGGYFSPSQASDIFHQRLLQDHRKHQIINEMIEGLDDGTFIGSEEDKRKLLEEEFQVEGAKEYHQLIKEEIEHHPQFYNLLPEAMSLNMQTLRREIIRTSFGEIDVVYPIGSVNKDDLETLVKLQEQNYQMFFKGIGNTTPIQIKTFVLPPDLLARAYSMNNKAIIPGSHINGIPAIHPGEFSALAMHEQIHAMCSEMFGNTKARFMAEGLTTLLERYWFPGLSRTDIGDHYGTNELLALGATGNIRRDPDILYAPDMIQKYVRSPLQAPEDEYYYRYALNIFQSVIEYSIESGQSSSSEEAIRRCVKVYADLCAENLEGGKRVRGILPGRKIVRDGQIQNGVKSSDLVKGALQKNGINPSDPKFLDILRKHQLSITSAVIPNKFH